MKKSIWLIFIVILFYSCSQDIKNDNNIDVKNNESFISEEWKINFPDMKDQPNY